MNSILSIYNINELVKAGRLSTEDGRVEIMEIIKNSPFYLPMKCNYSHVITLIDTSITPKELSESVEKYFHYLLTFCEKTSTQIDHDFKRQSHKY